MDRYKDLGAEEVEAAQLTPGNVKELTVLCHGVEVEELNPFGTGAKFVGVNVPTPDGKKRASEGDMIIKNYKGEFRVLKQGAFHSQYEPV